MKHHRMNLWTVGETSEVEPAHYAQQGQTGECNMSGSFVDLSNWDTRWLPR